MTNANDYMLRQGIIETLKARGMSQSEAARRAGISRTRLGDYVRGRRDMHGAAVDAVRRVLGLVIVDPLADDD